MCEREKRKNEQEYSQTRGFRNKHDSRIFVEPYDFFHVFSGIDFSILSIEQYFERFERRNQGDEIKRPPTTLAVRTQKIETLSESIYPFKKSAG